MSAPRNNQNAVKPPADQVKYPVTIRGTESERKLWRRAARGGKFNDFARRALTAASKPNQKTK